MQERGASYYAGQRVVMLDLLVVDPYMIGIPRGTTGTVVSCEPVRVRGVVEGVPQEFLAEAVVVVWDGCDAVQFVMNPYEIAPADTAAIAPCPIRFDALVNHHQSRCS